MSFIIPYFNDEVDSNLILVISDIDTIIKLYIVCNIRFGNIIDTKFILDEIVNNFSMFGNYNKFSDVIKVYNRNKRKPKHFNLKPLNLYIHPDLRGNEDDKKEWLLALKRVENSGIIKNQQLLVVHHFYINIKMIIILINNIVLVGMEI
jgi:hypothetical protein